MLHLFLRADAATVGGADSSQSASHCALHASDTAYLQVCWSAHILIRDRLCASQLLRDADLTATATATACCTHLPPKILQVFDYPSILELSEFLASTCPEAVAPPTAAPQPAATTAAAAAAPDATATAVQLVAAAVAELLGSTAAGGISADEPLMQAGVNSTLAVQLTGQLEATLGTSLPATLVRGLAINGILLL